MNELKILINAHGLLNVEMLFFVVPDFTEIFYSTTPGILVQTKCTFDEDFKTYVTKQEEIFSHVIPTKAYGLCPNLLVKKFETQPLMSYWDNAANSWENAKKLIKGPFDKPVEFTRMITRSPPLISVSSIVQNFKIKFPDHKLIFYIDACHEIPGNLKGLIQEYNKCPNVPHIYKGFQPRETLEADLSQIANVPSGTMVPAFVHRFGKGQVVQIKDPKLIKEFSTKPMLKPLMYKQVYTVTFFIDIKHNELYPTNTIEFNSNPQLVDRLDDKNVIKFDELEGKNVTLITIHVKSQTLLDYKVVDLNTRIMSFNRGEIEAMLKVQNGWNSLKLKNVCEMISGVEDAGLQDRLKNTCANGTLLELSYQDACEILKNGY